MEEENIVDIAFLFGLDYVFNRLGNSKGELIFLIFQKSSSLKTALKYVIHNMLYTQDIEELSSIFKVPSYFLNTLKLRSNAAGICNICDKYFTKIRMHLKTSHNLDIKSIDKFGEYFSEEAYFYLPLSVRDVDVVNEVTTLGDDNKVPNENIISCREDMKKYKKATYFSSCSEIPDSIVCMECGKIIERTKKKKHAALHRRSDVFECANCCR